MEEQLRQVRQFHNLVGSPTCSSTQLLEMELAEAKFLALELRALIARFNSTSSRCSQLAARTLMSVEELSEWVEAHLAHDLTAAIDAWADRCYVLFGDAVATGIPACEAFHVVHESNMTKNPIDVRTGKARKSLGYEAPRFDDEIVEKKPS